MNNSQIAYIDFLKFVGLTGIIIAHVAPSPGVFLLRSFDVPLMVILSSILAKRSYEKYKGKRHGVRQFWSHRIKRLVIPTWIFLFAFFAVQIACGIRRSKRYYLESFLLTRYGIGYVWIILIYLYCAMWIPLFDKVYKLKWGGHIAAILYALYEVSYYLGLDSNRLLDTTVFYMIPYGILAFFGFGYCFMKKRTKRLIIVIFASLFVCCALYYLHKTGKFQLTAIAKYPPRLYFMSYGIACSFALLHLCETHDFKIYGNKVVRFISKHSMWIYLWHIAVLEVVKHFNFADWWVAKLFGVYIPSVLLTYAVDRIVERIDRQRRGLLKYLS